MNNNNKSTSAQDCARCGNWHRSVRWDVLRRNGQDTKPVVNCDCCGATAELELWNRIKPMSGRKHQREPFQLQLQLHWRHIY